LRLLLPLVALSVGFACNPTGDDDDDNSGSTSTETLKSAFIKWNMAQCAFDERCLATNGPRHTTRAACEAEAQTVYDSLGLLVDEIYRLGDGSKVDACTAELNAKPCLGADVVPPSCQAALVIKDAAQVGDACFDGATGQYTVCGYGLGCSYSGNFSCGTCATQIAAGQACNPTSGNCQDGLYCNASTSTCQAKVGLGATCTSNGRECGGNTRCAGPDGSKTCQASRGAGQSCGDGLDCLQDLACTGGETQTCTPRLADGASCGRDASGPQCPAYCVFATSSAATGTCQYLEDPPGVGQPCVMSNGNYSCAYNGAYAVLGAQSCECQATHATGPCTSYSECTGWCEGLSGSTPGTCRQLAAVGERCDEDFECASYSCNTQAVPSVCAAVVCE
jgi:hypothetical protein